MTMDPDPYSTIYEEPSSYSEWTPASPRTDASSPEEPSRSTQRSPSPPKRPRNAKNLSLSVPTGPKASAAASSAPVSPFRSPRLPGRRPSNLTINIHSLHRHPSTPELYASQIGTPIVASPAPYTSTQHFPLNIDTRVNDPDRPKLRHTDPSVYFEESVEKEKAYPEGPRLIVEPNIWLYAEPDLELAKTYDLVVNVAREVMNPFMVPQPSMDNRISPQSDFDEHSTSPFSPASSSANPSPALTSSTSSGLSPKMPLKAIPETGPSSYKYDNVEYMHVPWDHNSSLSADLPGIVDHILERSEQGKKVLVHCQVFDINEFVLMTIVWCISISNLGYCPGNEENGNGHPRSVCLCQGAIALDWTEHVPHISAY
jgi:tyrosine-protein phosphatase